MEKKTKSLLLFHGSARQNALESANNFLDSITNEGINAAICFLRGQQPDLNSALLAAINEGFKKIHLIQLFLLPGAHVNEDIPKIISDFNDRFPEIEIEVTPNLVELPEFKEMIVELITNVRESKQ
ncbi:MAG: hypothetical protein Kow0029_06500 [Candidatus Rifleibacteriota bacterium]